MTYQTERSAIETYFGTQWDGATPVGYDGHLFTPEADSVALTIQSGAVLQGSMGRSSNRLDHIGLLIVAIYTEGGKGSAAWRGYAETIMGFLRDVTLDEDGAAITATADAFLRFSPPEIGESNRHPYISASFAAPPFHIANVAAPFVRYSFT